MLSLYRKVNSLVLSEQICSLLGLPAGTRLKKSGQTREILKKESLQIEDLVDILEAAAFGQLYLPSYTEKMTFKTKCVDLPIAVRYFRIGNHFAKQNILTAAAEAYEKALTVYPHLVPVRIELAKIKQRLFQHHVACRIIEEGVQLNPNIPSLWTHLAMFQMRLGMQSRSEESFSRAQDILEHEPKSAKLPKSKARWSGMLRLSQTLFGEVRILGSYHQLLQMVRAQTSHTILQSH